MILVCALLAAVVAPAAPATKELTALLQEFLAGASRNDAAVHDRFWSEDLVYTGSSGRRIGKADIMKDVTGAPPPKPGDPSAIYTAEDVRIQQFKDVAVVAFRLVGTTEVQGTRHVQKYLNTGTFVKRKGVWKATAWQATKVPRSEDDAKAEVAAADAALRASIASGGPSAVTPLLAKDFVGTTIYGDTALVQSATPPHAVLFVNQGEGWTVAALP